MSLLSGSEPGLNAEGVSFSVDGRAILQAVSLQLPAGQVLGLLGPNGAGKTTLLRALTGQLPCEGRVAWMGRPLATMPLAERARQIAIVNQLNDPVLALSLRQVVQMGLLPHLSLLGRRSPDDLQRVEQALARVGLSDRADQRFVSLSGGEQQRALIARALVQQARLIVLDEPVNHLDVYYQHDVLTLLRTLAHETGLTVVMSLHDLNLASMYCDRLALLHEGHLRAFGSAREVLVPELLQRVFRLPCVVRAYDGLMRVDFCPSSVGVSQILIQPSVISADGQVK
ncbi:ABC transporter ATP-binding protein [Parathalassolituus penaei]|uniref:ABC transporter ATP-binding protein n=1 Tax=Parathalassolituus penaei TaxID=2997323 RepID=A0A9X3EFR9_9GAMM|nr:ABC transporter ATP-binding protein [Parathalassolituus penaei]MCY0966732.1 ABC transporter ATP-binding protein [Parathalassolituus penaei]